MVKLPCILSRYCVKEDEKKKRKKKKEKNKREKKKKNDKRRFRTKRGEKRYDETIVCYLDNRTLFFLHFISLYVYGGHVDFV